MCVMLEGMISVCGVTKHYGGKRGVRALDDVSLEVERGEFVVIMGPSGCGKSTLLHCMGGLDQVDGGTVEVDGKVLGSLGDGELTNLRRKRLGFVFQFFNLLPTLTVRENALLPLSLAGRCGREDLERVDALLERVGLGDRKRHLPHELSGGQMQRAALARALAAEPVVVMADEPTGNLDSHASDEVMGLFEEMVREVKTTLVLVTHSDEVARRSDRVVRMKDGRVI